MDYEPSLKLRLKPKEERRLLAGHLWAFSNEIESVEGVGEPGSIAELLRHDGRRLALGFYHPHSLICFRVLSWGAGAPPPDLIAQRLAAAGALRERLLGSADAYRLVHAEADRLPGLVVDRYGDQLAVQITSAGMERLKDEIYQALEDRWRPAAIVERGDTGLRELEGLPQSRGVARGAIPGPARFSEGELHFETDLLEGQKTGAYLDQRCNRFAFRRLARGAEVLDLFCYQGGFALHAAAAGARAVLGVDASEAAIERANALGRGAGFEPRCHFVCGDAFSILRELRAQGRRFEVVNLDPPSFTRSKKQVAAARRGYRSLHREALLLLKPGGFLATSCCSHHLEEGVFLSDVERAAHALGRRLQQVRRAGAGPDHPVLPAMPETAYLKCAFYRVS